MSLRPERAGLRPHLAVSLALGLTLSLTAVSPSREARAQSGALPLGTVADVRLEGFRHVPSGRIRTLLKTRRPSALPWADVPPLRFDFLRADTFAIASAYRQNGYLDAEAAWRLEPAPRPGPLRSIWNFIVRAHPGDNAQRVVFVVREGQRSRIRDVELSGVTAYPVEQLRKRLYARPGRAYNPAFVIADTTRISAAYQDRGYLPHVLATTERDSLVVDVRYDVLEGLLYHFGEVTLRPPAPLHVREHLIRRELLIEKGDVFRRPRLDRSMERLYETGLFSQVQMTPLPDSARRNIDVDLRVRERKLRWVDAGIGSGTSERLQASAEWGHRSLGGSGILGAIVGRGALDGTWHFQNASIETRLVQPWMFATRTRGTLSGYVQRRDDRTDPNFFIRQNAQGMSFGLNRELNRFTRVSLTQDNQWVQQDIEFKPGLSDSALAALADDTPPRYTTHRVSFSADRDLRDSPFVTTRGSSQLLTFELAGGPLKGTSSFRKVQMSSAWFTPFSSGAVFATRVRGGVIRPFGSRPTFTPGTDIDEEVARVPTEYRFRLGGVSSIRGFGDNAIPVGGGLALLLVNLELRVPVAGPLGLELYVDAGNVWSRPADIKARQFSPTLGHQSLDDGDVRYVFGLGPRFNLPFGPLRLDLTWSLRPSGTGPALVAEPQFAIGPSF